MNEQRGFISIFAVLIVIAVVGVGGYLAFSDKGDKPDSSKIEATDQDKNERELGHPLPDVAPMESLKEARPQSSEGEAKNFTVPEETLPYKPQYPEALPQPNKVGLFGQQCEGAGDFKLKTFPINAENIEFIQPMGRVQDSHVTPTNHQYIVPVGTVSGSLVTGNPRKYEIKAPADGYIIAVELFKQPIEEQYRSQPYQDNYLVVFEHTCDFYTRLIHIDTLSEKVLSSFTFKDPNAPHPYASSRIRVKEGEIIGTVGPHSFDFQIIDAKVKNPRIINPKQLEEISVYTVDTFAYISDSLRSALLKKNLIKREPLGGTIGYDVLGKLAGNWFKIGRDRTKGDYWTDELSIVYDHLDPTQIRVSLGSFGGYPKAHGVKDNLPDPSTVGIGSGIIKYDLVTFDYYSDGEKWDAIHFRENLIAKNNDDVRGAVLFQLTDERTLKVEVFPGLATSQVTGFTNAAGLYER